LRLLAIAIFSLLVGALPARAADSAALPEGPVFLTLPVMTVPIFEGDAVTRQASVVLALELEKGKSEADLAPVKARLVDAYLTELTQLFEQRANADRIIDAQAIKPKLLETAQRIAGPGLVKDVLVQQAMERQRRR
jgi:hypothetical protein